MTDHARLDLQRIGTLARSARIVMVDAAQVRTTTPANRDEHLAATNTINGQAAEKLNEIIILLTRLGL